MEGLIQENGVSKDNLRGLIIIHDIVAFQLGHRNRKANCERV